MCACVSFFFFFFAPLVLCCRPLFACGVAVRRRVRLVGGRRRTRARDNLFAPCASRKWPRAEDRPKVCGVRPWPRPLDEIARARARAGNDCDARGRLVDADRAILWLRVPPWRTLFPTSFVRPCVYGCVRVHVHMTSLGPLPGWNGADDGALGVMRPNNRWGRTARRRRADAGSRHSGSRGACPARQTRARQTGQRVAGRNRTLPTGCRRAPA